MDYDIVIVGGGLVGASIAVALQRLSCRIAILETHLPSLTSVCTDTRPLSLAYGSQIILQTLGVWEQLAEISSPITTIHVSEQHKLGSICFRAQEEQVPALGYVVPFHSLQTILYQQAARQEGVEFIAIQNLTSINQNAQQTTVTCQTIHGEKTLRASLLIAADGTHSTTRKLLNIQSKTKNFGEIALTARIQFTKPHENTAYERFTDQGTIAILPLKHPYQSQLVKTLSSELAEQVQSWSDQFLAETIQTSFGDRLGPLQILERGQQYPLQLTLAEEQIRPGVVLLGNAAHTIYPLAAQGFNLALRDVACLAEELVAASGKKQSLGDLQVLKRYWQWRSSDQRSVNYLTSGAVQLFALQLPLVSILRSVGLLATDLLPPLKHKLAKRLMGLAGRLPKLALGIPL